MYFKQPQLLLMVLAWLAADLLVPLLISLAPRFRAFDRPHSYKSHQQPIPFVGGIGVFLAFALVLLLTVEFESSIRVSGFARLLDVVLHHPRIRMFTGIVVGGALMLLVGVVDDYKPINAFVKLIILFLATFLLTELGVGVSLFGEMLWLNRLITLFWISGVISAINSFDNTDGAVGGVAAISLLTAFLIGWGTSPTDNQYWLTFVVAPMFGACLGFLRWNFAPAKVYLGNGGAFGVGFVLGAISVLGGWSTQWYRALIIPILLVGMPIFDIVACTGFRYRARVVGNFYQAVVYCGRDHVAHRLMALGLRKRQAVLVMYACQVMLCGAAWALARFDRSLDDGAFFAVIAAVGGLFLLLSVVLWRAPVYHRREAPRAPRYAPDPISAPRPMTTVAPRAVDDDGEG